MIYNVFGGTLNLTQLQLTVHVTLMSSLTEQFYG